MPKIDLKPNSPEFADKKQRVINHVCDMPGCAEAAEHRAPKDRDLEEYYHFCYQHVSDYNRAWNYFEGMSSPEIEDHILRSLYGDRPTWRYDHNKSKEDILRHKIRQEYEFTDAPPDHEENLKARRAQINKNTPEYEALCIMGLEPPIQLDEIKARYKELAKKHHPDHNQNDPEAEELLKDINMAYTILKLSYAKFEKLEEI